MIKNFNENFDNIDPESYEEVRSLLIETESALDIDP